MDTQCEQRKPTNAKSWKAKRETKKKMKNEHSFGHFIDFLKLLLAQSNGKLFIDKQCDECKPFCMVFNVMDFVVFFFS